jgi:hypothetical protein
MVVDAEARSWCGCRGWKLLDLRRDAASVGDARERAMQRRVTCVACNGTGSADGGS